jgi:hypothetical protein
MLSVHDKGVTAMTTLSTDRTPVAPATQRLLASRKAQADETPHPAMLALARQSRATGRRNRRLAEYLRIERGIEA